MARRPPSVWNGSWNDAPDNASAAGAISAMACAIGAASARAAREHTSSQLLAGGFDLRNTAARLGHSGGGATTLRHYADPVPEVDRRAAAYLAKLTARSAAQTGRRSRSRAHGGTVGPLALTTGAVNA